MKMNDLEKLEEAKARFLATMAKAAADLADDLDGMGTLDLSRWCPEEEFGDMVSDIEFNAYDDQPWVDEYADESRAYRAGLGVQTGRAA